MQRFSRLAIALLLTGVPAISWAARPAPATNQIAGFFHRGRPMVRGSQRPAVVPSSIVARPIRNAASDGSVTISGLNIGGWTVYFPPMTVRAEHLAKSSTPSTDPPPNYDNSNDIQNDLNLRQMIATQDMVNNQLQNDRIQDMLNTQNMINNQNMVNAQNAMDAQNAINAQMTQ